MMNTFPNLTKHILISGKMLLQLRLQIFNSFLPIHKFSQHNHLISTYSKHPLQPQMVLNKVNHLLQQAVSKYRMPNLTSIHLSNHRTLSLVKQKQKKPMSITECHIFKVEAITQTCHQRHQDHRKKAHTHLSHIQ